MSPPYLPWPLISLCVHPPPHIGWSRHSAPAGALFGRGHLLDDLERQGLACARAIRHVELHEARDYLLDILRAEAAGGREVTRRNVCRDGVVDGSAVVERRHMERAANPEAYGVVERVKPCPLQHHLRTDATYGRGKIGERDRAVGTAGRGYRELDAVARVARGIGDRHIVGADGDELRRRS